MLKLPMLKFKTLISPLALALSLAIAPPLLANAEHGRDHDKSQVRHMMAKLDLSEEQRQDVKQILQQSRADADLTAEDRKHGKTDLMNLIHSDSWDEAAVTSALQQNQQTKASLGLKKASTMHQIWLVLSDAQQTKFAELADSKRANKKGKANKKDRAEGQEKSRGEGRDQFKQLALTDEQKTAIKAIKQQAKAQGEQSKELQNTYRQAERALIASTTFNDTAYQALQTEYQDKHLQHALLMAKTRHDIWQVLSVEQQAKALAKMAERKERS